MNTTLTREFDETFSALLDATNLVHRLRTIDADFASRLRAQGRLMDARIDVGRARAALV